MLGLFYFFFFFTEHCYDIFYLVGFMCTRSLTCKYAANERVTCLFFLLTYAICRMLCLENTIFFGCHYMAVYE